MTVHSLAVHSLDVHSLAVHFPAIPTGGRAAPGSSAAASAVGVRRSAQGSGMALVVTRSPETGAPHGSRGDRFAGLLSAFHDSGGCTRGDDVARLFAELHRGDYVSLARLIARGDVFGFKWRDELWIPMFQFRPDDLAVRGSAGRVLAELRGVFDGWALATWFSSSHPSLGGRRPVDLLEVEPAGVLRAARASHRVAALASAGRSRLTPAQLASAGRVIEHARRRDEVARSRASPATATAPAGAMAVDSSLAGQSATEAPTRDLAAVSANGSSLSP